MQIRRKGTKNCMIRWVVGLLFGLVFILGLHYSGVVRFSFLATPEEEIVWEPSPAPSLSLQSIKGEKFELNQFQGKIVLLNFWATWCGPCLDEFPAFFKIAEEMNDRLVFIGISTDKDAKTIYDYFQKYLPQFQGQLDAKNFLIALDSDRKISEGIFNVIRFPETIIIDPSGRMVRKIVGPSDWKDPKMKEYLVKLATASTSE
ncbi:MAG: TlpA disulfide reductase family protein [Deltaproteobacteria bacterium]|nr:TlpA disulfide reductase family protein [Deltaproteobacteria bacterium]